MGVDRLDDDGSVGVSSNNCKTGCGGDGAEGRRWVMIVGLGGRGGVVNRTLADKGVREERAGKNCRVCHREAYLQTMYKRRENGWIQ